MADEHASPAEDSIYSGTLPGSDRLRFFKLHRIGNAYHLYVERVVKTLSGKHERGYTPTGQVFQCRPEGANEALLRSGFKFYSANWFEA